VKNPRFGHGKNMNPCIDCRLVMLQEAAQYMEMTGAHFIITGEVLGQRPMLQRRFTLDLIAKECRLDGRLVRPLSGKLLPPTWPEKQGLIQRDWLLDIEGRSRKRQIALAAEFGLTEYPSPAGGCLLTDRGYSNRLRDLLNSDIETDFNDLNLLRVGRHFRLGEKVRLVVGRDERENDIIESLYRIGDCKLEALDHKSPVGLLRGHYNAEQKELAAAIVARYCDGRNESQVRVTFTGHAKTGDIVTAPAPDTTVVAHRI